MVPFVLEDLILRAREHVGREIDPDDLAVARICRKRRAGAGADFENARAAGNVERLDDAAQAGIKDLAEGFVVKRRQVGVELALVGFYLTHNGRPRREYASDQANRIGP